ncbi:dynactin subunit 1 isoform X2 [Ischnura elegans]|uniref:dynactin subunit 1 isoform X2 n=1 Tax=Ischnura elegans TaxID=197161 RepID=UPI001ED8A610|nr:dynactin subunit 1 isoform X2 [Ischnura elegans]
MAEKSVRIGQRVEVGGKDVQGVVAYVGTTLFASGKWIGVILDEPKGKNNGTVMNKQYFECKENHGTFVRQSQISVIDGGTSTEATSPSTPSTSSSITTPTSEERMRGRASSLRKFGTTTTTRLTQSYPSSVRRRAEPTPPRRKVPQVQTPRKPDNLRLPVMAGSTRAISDQTTPESGTTSDAASPAVSQQQESYKRASFVEGEQQSSKEGPASSAMKAALQGLEQTGFVETLNPQYTPGHPISPGGATMEERLASLQLQRELESARAEITDLQEKLETLKVKRMQDKERLKDYDKTRLQLEHMMEFKTQIMNAQINLQRELQAAKQEAREANEARERHADEMADLAETVEMATLDKEMAEEKAETLQQELEQYKEKVEELQVDLDILKAEVAERGGEGGGGGSVEGAATSLEIKQLQQQNARLRDTLVRMRDLSAHEKHEFQKLQKEADEKRSEITELSRTKEKLSSRVEELERQISYLHEQVDLALGAEQMVENLTEAKLNLEDKVAELEEAVADLEALHDMNDQLQEGSRELDLQLREDLEMAECAKREALRERDKALEALADRDSIITKFRALVQKLQDQVIELRDKVISQSGPPSVNMALTSGPSSYSEEGSSDLRKMLADTKANARALELELYRVEVLQFEARVNYLISFMPEGFTARGADQDAIETLLLVSRLPCKCEILVNQVRERFPQSASGTTPTSEDASELQVSHSMEQSSFRHHLSFMLFYIMIILHRFEYVLNNCTVELLLKLGTLLPEMVAQEKSLDFLLDLLKKGQLDENTSLEGVEKCASYFVVLYNIHVGSSDGIIMPGETGQKVTQGCSRALSAACDAILSDVKVLSMLVEGDGNELVEMMSNWGLGIEGMHKSLWQMQRLATMQESPANVTDALLKSTSLISRVLYSLRSLRKSAMVQITSQRDKGKVLGDKLLELAAVAVESAFENHFGGDEVEVSDRGPVERIRSTLEFVSTNIGRSVQTLKDLEFGGIATPAESKKNTAPITLRSQATRRELEEAKQLQQRLVSREEDIRELRRALKVKQEELSEMVVRKELAEKKLGNVSKDYSMAVEKLERKLEDSQALLKRKEKEFEETMDHLQADIDCLETERGELKDKLKAVSRKALMEGLAKSAAASAASPTAGGFVGVPASGVNGSPGIQPSGPVLSSTVRDSPLLISQIHSLQMALRNEVREKWQIQMQQTQNRLQSLPPLKVPKKQTSNRLLELEKETEATLQEIRLKMASAKVVDISGRKPGTVPTLEKTTPAYHLISEKVKVRKLQSKLHQLQSAVLKEVVERKNKPNVNLSLAQFPTPELTQAISSKEAGLVQSGKLLIPANTAADTKKLIVDSKTLEKIHSVLVF